eukprot:TRINITY_DN19491_c0_g1_i1.p1 TRINITY_DN19491_c0_g1~~TRINITY_DN19491_c0_g1_i1.p1  ORF type:complete len:217 (+),score=48.50 TRINITY_DN19491_c0_g1_i1:133-783(+)
MCIRDRMYSSLNSALRTQDERAIAPWLPFIRLLQHALLKLPPAEPHDAIFRGTSSAYHSMPQLDPPRSARRAGAAPNTADPSKQLFKNLRDEDDEMVLWGFSSCTRNAEVAESYFGTEKATVWQEQETVGPVPLEIDMPFQGPRILFAIDGGSSARDIQEYSAVAAEDEVLLPCALGFKVKSVIGISSGMLVVHLAQLQSQKEQQGSFERGTWKRM